MISLRDKIRKRESGAVTSQQSDAAQSASVRTADIRDRHLLKELTALNANLPKTCKIVHPDVNKMYEFTLIVEPRDCIWSDGTFYFDISVPEGYNHLPPNVTCKTQIWHPNIDTQGRVCLSVLRQSSLDSTGWNPTRSLYDVVTGIDSLFTDLCDFNDPLNSEAANQFTTNPDAFNRKARDYVCQYASKCKQ